MTNTKPLSWTGLFSFPGKEEFRIGNVYTKGFYPDEAKRKLEETAARLLPDGWKLGWYGRGRLDYTPGEEGE